MNSPRHHQRLADHQNALFIEWPDFWHSLRLTCYHECEVEAFLHRLPVDLVWERSKADILLVLRERERGQMFIIINGTLRAWQPAWTVELNFFLYVISEHPNVWTSAQTGTWRRDGTQRRSTVSESLLQNPYHCGTNGISLIVAGIKRV